MTIHHVPDVLTKYSPRRSFRGWVASRRQGLAAAFAVLVMLLLLWLYAGRWYEDRLLLEQRAEAVSEVSARGSALASAVNRRLARLQGLHAFVKTEGSEPDFGQKFEQFAADLYAGSRGIRSLAVAPEGEVRYIYPLNGNEAVLGYQPLLDPRPEVAADVQRAITTDQVILSGPVELLQGGSGLIARQAVYQDGRYWGLVNIAVDMDSLLTEVGLEGGAGQLVYALRDSYGRVIYGPPSIFSSKPIITQVILPERYWELAGVPRDGWSTLVWQSLLISRIGSLFSIALLASLVYLTVNRQSRLATAVEQRTLELSMVNEQLEQRVEERTLELTMLLNFSQSIVSTLELEALLERVLDKLSPVVEYTGGAILTLKDDCFIVRTSKGYFPQESAQQRSYSFNNIISRQLIEERLPILIPDVSMDTPLALAFRHTTGLGNEQDPHIRSWMGIPLIARERVIGMLALHHQEPAIYTQRDADLALAFANQVAVAIQNARLHEKAQRLAVLQERQRLARELHDSISQALYGIALGTRTARTLLDRTQLAAESKATLSEPLEYILFLAEGGLAEMRALIFELRPESLESEGLVAALVKQATVLQTRHRLEVVTLLEEEPDVPLATKEALYRVSGEALNNVFKHAGATKITICLSMVDKQLVLEIADNGKGFDQNGNFTGHLGLRSMRERLEHVRGTLTITSAAHHGTKIVAMVPRPDDRK